MLQTVLPVQTNLPMKFKVEIDSNSGFCAGVIRAISTAEEFLEKGCVDKKRLYSLGAIVHNDIELTRLMDKGLVTIDKDDLEEMVDAQGERLLIRAHGEPPSTYTRAENLGFEVVDCTCPVVLKLQSQIRQTYQHHLEKGKGQIIIFGKPGHAEVLGLIGQTNGTAIVVENLAMLEEAVQSGQIKLNIQTEVFSQTTKSPADYNRVCTRLEEMMAQYNELSIARFKGRNLLIIHNTICSQVATRHKRLSTFALEHDIIIFVSGKSSSNGRVLCELCKSLNIRTYLIESVDEIKKEWFRPDDNVGVCGATSTPKWLLEKVGRSIEKLIL